MRKGQTTQGKHNHEFDKATDAQKMVIECCPLGCIAIIGQ